MIQISFVLPVAVVPLAIAAAMGCMNAMQIKRPADRGGSAGGNLAAGGAAKKAVAPREY
jgi:hypothetical protein